MGSTTRMLMESGSPHVSGAQPSHVWGTFPPPSTTGAYLADGGQTKVVRVMIIDHQGTARRTLRWELRLEPDIEIVGDAKTAVEGLAMAQDCHPDIVVVDVEMPGMDGVEAAEQLRALAPDCLIMLLTVRDSIETHGRAKAAGARVVVEKGNPAIFKHALHDLIQFVKARNIPAWPALRIENAA